MKGCGSSFPFFPGSAPVFKLRLEMRIMLPTCVLSSLLICAAITIFAVSPASARSFVSTSDGYPGGKIEPEALGEEQRKLLMSDTGKLLHQISDTSWWVQAMSFKTWDSSCWLISRQVLLLSSTRVINPKSTHCIKALGRSVAHILPCLLSFEFKNMVTFANSLSPAHSKVQHL